LRLDIRGFQEECCQVIDLAAFLLVGWELILAPLREALDPRHRKSSAV
jgi:hypothetical protein